MLALPFLSSCYFGICTLTRLVSSVLQIMVDLMGGQFSKPLVANRVTHLICYKFEGESLIAIGDT